MCSECFDLCAEAGIPETDGAVLTACEDVFCGTFGVASDVD